MGLRLSFAVGAEAAGRGGADGDFDPGVGVAFFRVVAVMVVG